MLVTILSCSGNDKDAFPTPSQISNSFHLFQDHKSLRLRTSIKTHSTCFALEIYTVFFFNLPFFNEQRDKPSTSKPDDLRLSRNPPRGDMPEISKNPICRSDACEDIALRIQETRDISRDPCDDFYDYVCGNISGPPGDFTLNQVAYEKWLTLFTSFLGCIRLKESYAHFCRRSKKAAHTTAHDRLQRGS